MADIQPVLSSIGENTLMKWEALTNANSNGLPVQPIKYSALVANVQVFGTFNGATVDLQGSNDGTNWVTLRRSDETDISFSAAGASEVSTSMAYIRPSTSGGGVSQDIDCLLLLRGET